MRLLVFLFLQLVVCISDHSHKSLKNSWNTLVPAVLQFSSCYPFLLINSLRSKLSLPSPALHICQREILAPMKNGVGTVPRKFPLINTKPLSNAFTLNLRMVSSSRQVSLDDWKQILSPQLEKFYERSLSSISWCRLSKFQQSVGLTKVVSLWRLLFL